MIEQPATCHSILGVIVVVVVVAVAMFPRHPSHFHDPPTPHTRSNPISLLVVKRCTSSASTHYTHSSNAHFSTSPAFSSYTFRFPAARGLKYANGIDSQHTPPTSRSAKPEMRNVPLRTTASTPNPTTNSHHRTSPRRRCRRTPAFFASCSAGGAQSNVAACCCVAFCCRNREQSGGVVGSSGWHRADRRSRVGGCLKCAGVLRHHSRSSSTANRDTFILVALARTHACECVRPNGRTSGLLSARRRSAPQSTRAAVVLTTRRCGGAEEPSSGAAAAAATTKSQRNPTAMASQTALAAGGGGGNREFVEGWILAQTLGEGAYGE